jgi:hypothetical protein
MCLGEQLNKLDKVAYCVVRVSSSSDLEITRKFKYSLKTAPEHTNRVKQKLI